MAEVHHRPQTNGNGSAPCNGGIGTSRVSKASLLTRNNSFTKAIEEGSKICPSPPVVKSKSLGDELSGGEDDTFAAKVRT